jgi:BirA family biotin operon repressor/biotin-[acetyl-CoA-carboxylase] ligase
LAAADLVDSVLPGQARCKWPNDILVAGRKVAGILLESALRRAHEVDWVVLGIGVNLAHHPGLGPPRPSASLVEAGATPMTPEEALPRIVEALARWRDTWERNGFAAIRTAWLARAHGLGGSVTVSSGHTAFTGMFEGLDADGALVLLEEGGTRRRIAAGDVFFGDAGTADAARD